MCVQRRSMERNTISVHTKSREICEVYCDRIVSVQTVRKWIRLFKEGCANVTEKNRDERPSDARNTNTIAEAHSLLEDDCH